MAKFRVKLETSVNLEEDQLINAFCKKHNVSRYTLIRRAVFEKIKQQNSTLKDFT